MKKKRDIDNDDELDAIVDKYEKDMEEMIDEREE